MKLSRLFVCHLAVFLITVTNLAAPFLKLDETRMSDSYGRISWKDEKPRLKALAYELRNKSDLNDVIYFYFYGDRNSCLSQVRKRIEKAKNYLVSEQKIPNERIVLKEGGYRENLTVDVYIQPRDFKITPLPNLISNKVQTRCKNEK
jgi:hypothetical protein